MTRHPAAVAEHHNDSAAIKKNPTYSAWRSGQFSTTKRLRLAKTADFRGFRASRIAQLRKLGLIFSRSYNSDDAARGQLGVGWHNEYIARDLTFDWFRVY